MVVLFGVNYGITSRCTWNVSLIPKWDLSLPKNNTQLILNNYGVGQPKPLRLFHSNQNLSKSNLSQIDLTLKNYDKSQYFSQTCPMFKIKNTSQLLFFPCLCVISWDKHGVPLHSLAQTAHENQI